jgi:hypothetical protein
MSQLPFGVQIDSGVLRIGQQTIFLKNVTSTRIDAFPAKRKYKGIGILLFMGCLVGGLAMLGNGYAVIGVTLAIVAFIALLAFSHDVASYTLVIVTSAGESKVLTNSEYATLKEIENAIANAIAAL